MKDFAARVNRRVPKLHVLQLVAGIAAKDFKRSPDGHELGLQINVLSTALMALLLLPKVRETAVAEGPSGFVPHISFVNSAAHREVDPKDLPAEGSGETLIQRLDDESKFDTRKEYFLVKLAGIFVVRGLAERIGNDRIVVNASCPGLCKTNMGRDFPLAARVFMSVNYFFLWPIGRAGQSDTSQCYRAWSQKPRKVLDERRLSWVSFPADC